MIIGSAVSEKILVQTDRRTALLDLLSPPVTQVVTAYSVGSDLIYF